MKLCVLAISLVSLIGSSTVFARPIEPYNANNAVSYARTWAYSRNTSYPVLDANSSQGGDCTNFVSQALRAGGWRNTATTSTTSDLLWWFTNKTTTGYSQSWSTAHGFFRHMNGGVNPPGTGTSYEGWTKWDGATSLNYGDVVSADWTGDNAIDHTMIVTGFRRMANGLVEPRFTYHSNDRKDFPLSDLMAALRQSGYNNAKFYRFGIQNFCSNPLPSQIF